MSLKSNFSYFKIYATVSLRHITAGPVNELNGSLVEFTFNV